jgi:hypothetical protein
VGVGGGCGNTRLCTYVMYVSKGRVCGMDDKGVMPGGGQCKLSMRMYVQYVCMYVPARRATCE